MGHVKALVKGTAKYPLRKLHCKVFSITRRATSHTHENVYLGVLTKRVVVYCVDNDAYNGTFAENPCFSLMTGVENISNVTSYGCLMLH